MEYILILNDKISKLNVKNYKSVILLSAISNPIICHENKEYSNKLNVDATIELVKYLSDNNIKLIFFIRIYI